MANLPYQPFAEQEPGFQPAPSQSLNVPPEATGAGIAESAGKAAATLSEIQNRTFATALKLQDMANETAANNAVQNYAGFVTDKEVGYRQLQGQNAVDAFPQFKADLENEFNRTKATLASPMARLAFERDGRSFYNRSMYAAGLHAGDQGKAANDKSWEGRIITDRASAVLHANDPDVLEDALQNTIDHSLVLAQQQGLPKDAADALVSKNVGDLYQHVVEAKMAAGDLDGAEHLMNIARDRTIPGTDLPLLDGNHLADISRNIATRQYTESQRALAQQAREEAIAARQLRETQAQNEGQIVGEAVATGHIPDAATLGQMLQNQQITVAGYNAIFDTIRNKDRGIDNPAASASLWTHVLDRSASLDDVYAAMNAGTIAPNTGVAMIRSITYRQRVEANSLDRQNYSTLRTSLGFDAFEHSMFDFNKEERAAQQALWAQAQQEWSQRVTVGKENSTEVLHDMLPRYARPANTPAAWPKPRMGAVGSGDEALAVGQRTEQAFRAGQIDQPTYDAERALILRYKNFYDAQARADAARKSVGAAGGQKAKPKGVTPAEMGP